MKRLPVLRAAGRLLEVLCFRYGGIDKHNRRDEIIHPADCLRNLGSIRKLMRPLLITFVVHPFTIPIQHRGLEKLKAPSTADLAHIVTELHANSFLRVRSGEENQP